MIRTWFELARADTLVDTGQDITVDIITIIYACISEKQSK